MKEVTVVLAEDHHVVRQGIRLLLESQPGFRVVGEAGDGLEAIRLVEQKRPDILVLDLMMPGLDGASVTQRVSRRFPQTRVVILSMQDEESHVYGTLAKGAAAYVVKDSTVTELMAAVRAVLAGRRYLSPPFSEEGLQRYLQWVGGTRLDAQEMLTDREREVLQLTAEGHSTIRIGARLCISPRTVESHRATMMRKLGLQSHVDLVRYAIQKEIISGEKPTDRLVP